MYIFALYVKYFLCSFGCIYVYIDDTYLVWQNMLALLFQFWSSPCPILMQQMMLHCIFYVRVIFIYQKMWFLIEFILAEKCYYYLFTKLSFSVSINTNRFSVLTWNWLSHFRQGKRKKLAEHCLIPFFPNSQNFLMIPFHDWSWNPCDIGKKVFESSIILCFNFAGHPGFLLTTLKASVF